MFEGTRIRIVTALEHEIIKKSNKRIRFSVLFTSCACSMVLEEQGMQIIHLDITITWQCPLYLVGTWKSRYVVYCPAFMF